VRAWKRQRSRWAGEQELNYSPASEDKALKKLRLSQKYLLKEALPESTISPQFMLLNLSIR
jgi:hypothetical protein